MKKFIICLLLICTICLGCFALTACDKGTEEVSKIEFIKNVAYTDSNVNKYYFRIWHPIEWFKQNIFFRIQYKLNKDDNYITFDNRDIISEEVDHDFAPDSWMYIILRFETEPSNFYIRVVSISYSDNGDIIYGYTLISQYFDLTGTYKTA